MNVQLYLYPMVEDSQKKEAIFSATIKLVKEKGFQSTPMSLIAKEANVAAGTIYLYFKSKDDLLNKLYLKIKKEYSDALMEGYDPEEPIRDSFELIWRNTLNFQLNRSAEFSFMEQFKNSPFINRMTVEEGIRIFQPAKIIIERGRKEKVIKNLTSSLLFALFFAPLSEIVKEHMRFETVPSEEIVKEVFLGCWDAIKN